GAACAGGGAEARGRPTRAEPTTAPHRAGTRRCGFSSPPHHRNLRPQGGGSIFGEGALAAAPDGPVPHRPGLTLVREQLGRAGQSDPGRLMSRQPRGREASVLPSASRTTARRPSPSSAKPYALGRTTERPTPARDPK